MSIKIIRNSNWNIIYDDKLVPEIDRSFFERETHRNNPYFRIDTTGRGDTIFFKHHESNLVLKKYIRGGLVKHISRDKFVFISEKTVRSFAEFNILNKMTNAGLNVPKPVAAFYERDVLFFKSKILCTEIKNCCNLHEKLLNRSLNEHDWKSLGVQMNNFFINRFYHPDLNAKNILFDENNKIFFIDFSSPPRLSPSFMQKNFVLRRVWRSLKKLSTRNNIPFPQIGWEIIKNQIK